MFRSPRPIYDAEAKNEPTHWSEVYLLSTAPHLWRFTQFHLPGQRLKFECAAMIIMAELVPKVEIDAADEQA